MKGAGTKKARGEVKRLLKAIGELQGKISAANPDRHPVFVLGR
jgi:hypothetical protein